MPHTSWLLYSDDSFSPVDGEPHSTSSGVIESSGAIREVMDSDSISRLSSSSASPSTSATADDRVVAAAAGAAKTTIFTQALNKVKQMWDESDMDPAGNPVDASESDGSPGSSALAFIGKSQLYVFLPSCWFIL